MSRICRLSVTSAMVAMVLGLNLSCEPQETAQSSMESSAEQQEESQISEEGVVIEIADEKQFDALVLRSDKVALVDFWAPWCGPCLMVSPLIEELASEYAGQVVFAKVNVDENRALSERYHIMSIPTVMCFKARKVTETIVGARDKSAYRKMLDSHMEAGGQE